MEHPHDPAAWARALGAEFELSGGPRREAVALFCRDEYAEELGPTEALTALAWFENWDYHGYEDRDWRYAE